MDAEAPGSPDACVAAPFPGCPLLLREFITSARGSAFVDTPVPKRPPLGSRLGWGGFMRAMDAMPACSSMASVAGRALCPANKCGFDRDACKPRPTLRAEMSVGLELAPRSFGNGTETGCASLSLLVPQSTSSTSTIGKALVASCGLPLRGAALAASTAPAPIGAACARDIWRCSSVSTPAPRLRWRLLSSMTSAIRSAEIWRSTASSRSSASIFPRAASRCAPTAARSSASPACAAPRSCCICVALRRSLRSLSISRSCSSHCHRRLWFSCLRRSNLAASMPATRAASVASRSMRAGGARTRGKELTGR